MYCGILLTSFLRYVHEMLFCIEGFMLGLVLIKTLINILAQLYSLTFT